MCIAEPLTEPWLRKRRQPLKNQPFTSLPRCPRNLPPAAVAPIGAYTTCFVLRQGQRAMQPLLQRWPLKQTPRLTSPGLPALAAPPQLQQPPKRPVPPQLQEPPKRSAPPPQLQQPPKRSLSPARHPGGSSCRRPGTKKLRAKFPCRFGFVLASSTHPYSAVLFCASSGIPTHLGIARSSAQNLRSSGALLECALKHTRYCALERAETLRMSRSSAQNLRSSAALRGTARAHARSNAQTHCTMQQCSVLECALKRAHYCALERADTLRGWRARARRMHP